MHHITYDRVAKLFNETKKPPRSKKYNEFQRPLRRVTESWLMLQKDAHSYVYIINGAEVVRVFEPNAEGEYEVAIRGLYATFDIQQMWKYTGFYANMQLFTSNDEQVRLPLNPYYKAQDKDFSALLTFNKDDKLIVDKSWHADVYRLKSTDKDKAKRKNLKAQLDAFVTLQMFRLPTLIENVSFSVRAGTPFGENTMSYATINDMRSFLSEDEIQVDSPKFMQIFNDMAQNVLDTLVSKKLYNLHGYSAVRFMETGHTYSTNANKYKEEAEDLLNSIVPDDIKASLVSQLLKLANMKDGSQSVALPQFANTLPRKFFYYKRDEK
jgi:hypothetical protein